MNRLMGCLAALTLAACASATLQAAPQATAGEARLLLTQSLPNSGNDNPYNSPTRRANPNSMQGTQPSAPAIRGPNTVPVPRPPTLENGGIGNGYPRTGTPPRATPQPQPGSRDPQSNDRR